MLSAFLAVSSALRLIAARRFYGIEPNQFISPLNFIVSFVLATIFIILIPFIFRRRKRGIRFIFRVVFIFSVFFGSLLTFSIWTSSIVALILTAILLVIWLIKPFVLLHNLIIMLTVAGFSAVLGLGFGPLMIIAFLVLFSVYDFIAVYKTKHMIKMVKETMSAGVLLGFAMPLKVSDAFSSLKKIKIGGNFLILGSGDIIFPLLLAVSLAPYGWLPAAIVVLFSLGGLLFSLFIFTTQKNRSPIPALPPIAFFSILGYLIIVLLQIV